jgi:thiol-disulfide isomerase/thioredoxin
VPGSAKAIIEARAGRPFILTFWSVDCVHCRAELEQLAALSRAHPALEVVLVSTDGPEASREVSAALRPYRFARMESWMFAMLSPNACVSRLIAAGGGSCPALTCTGRMAGPKP